MRRRSPPRVVGPYQERDRWRIVVVENGKRKSFFFATKEEALKLRADFAKEVELPPSRKVADVLAEWEAGKMSSGTCAAKSIQHRTSRLRLFLAPVLEQEIRVMTPRRAAALYQGHTERISLRTGKPLSAASHRFDRWSAQDFFAWSVYRGYLGLNPFTSVKPVGKIGAGKTQLRIEEARRFTEAALRYFEEADKPLAVGALLALTMGLRTSEAMGRVVRDLDDGARYLWIDTGKTANARRHLEVPEVLQPYLLRLADGKRPDELLFGLSKMTGRPRQRQAMHRTVQTICQKAGVPVVCTHSLRGLWATLAIQSGAASHAVAASLGHHSFAVTQKYYAQPSAITNASTARVSGMLDGARSSVRLSAEDLYKQLDEDTLRQIGEMLTAQKRQGDPAQ